MDKDYKKLYEDLKAEYDTAVGRAKEELNGPDKALVEYIFPQLKKSEAEIVIGALKSGFKTLEKENKLKGLGGLRFDRIIAWLDSYKEATNFAELRNKLSAKEQEIMFNAWPRDFAADTWSENDAEMARLIGNAITTKASADYLDEHGITMIDAHTWLENLQRRCVTPRKNFTEEDKRKVKFLCNLIRRNFEEGRYSFGEHAEYGFVTKDGVIDMIQELCYGANWKPTDEQMEALHKCCIDNKTVNSLYEDLKDLMES